MSPEQFRREIGMDMIREDRGGSVPSKKPEPPKEPIYRFVGGVIMVSDGGGWRLATAEEIEEFTGGVACWPSNEEGEL